MTSPRIRETAKLWCDEQLGNLELLRARYVTFAFAPHFHDTFAVGITEAGAQTFSNRRCRNIVMPAGSVAIVHPGEVHTSCSGSEGGWAYRMLYPSAELLRRAASEVSDRQCPAPDFQSPVIQDEHLAGLVLRLHRALEDPHTTGIERESRLVWTLSQLVTRHAEDRPSPRRVPAHPRAVRVVKEFLHEAHAENVTLQRLVDLVGLSRFHLLRLFRDAVGLPPHAYLVMTRVNRAKALLREDCPPAEVATRTGFFDQSHLNRHFKSIVGLPPGQYQRAQHRTRRA